MVFFSLFFPIQCVCVSVCMCIDRQKFCWHLKCQNRFDIHKHTHTRTLNQKVCRRGRCIVVKKLNHTFIHLESKFDRFSFDIVFFSSLGWFRRFNSIENVEFTVNVIETNDSATNILSAVTMHSHERSRFASEKRNKGKKRKIKKENKSGKIVKNYESWLHSV